MPGIVTHLVIAEKVLKRLPEGMVSNKALYYAGTITPDSVHAKKDYKREYKKQSHLREGIPDSDFHMDEYYNLYKSRLESFVTSKIHPDNRFLDLDLGYLVHLIADEVFVLTVRRELVIELEKNGVSQKSKVHTICMSVMNNTDSRLVTEYMNLDTIKSLLKQVEPFSMEGYLTRPNLTLAGIGL